ncbi:hypothetical protein ACWGIN_01925 [Streptomyces sp. NPDC054861]
MSGSIMYSPVALDPGFAALQLAVRASRAAARRARERERAEERAALAAERARQAAQRRERARAEAERRRAEVAARRQARLDAHAADTRRERGRAEARRLDEIERLVAPLRASAKTATALAPVERRLVELRGAVGGEAPLGAEIEELRGRVVVLVPHGGVAPADRTDRGETVRALERRLEELAADGEAHDREGARESAELLERLRAAARQGQEVRFDALLGTVEHAVNRHAAAVARGVEGDRRRAEEEARRVEEDVRRAEETEARAAEEERRRGEEAEARAEALLAALTEAADRFKVVERGAEDAVRDAVDLADPELAEELEQAVRAVTTALQGRRADAALAAVAGIERLLPAAEERLDELQLAHARRGELARALKDAMTDAGLDFAGGEDRGELLVLSFERPSGAVYEATVGTGADGTAVLTYHVDGEADMSPRPSAEGAVCAPEELLDRVHRAMNGEGFVPGELTWDGKPPRRHARGLPGDETGRTR